MQRRKVIQAIAIAPVALGQELSPTAAETLAQPARKFFQAEEWAQLLPLCAAIFPPNGPLPGAVEAGTPEFLDFLLSRSPKQDQQLYRRGLAAAATSDLLPLLDKPWTYSEPVNLPVRFMRRLKDDVLRATFNSRPWIIAANRRGGGMNYYWRPVE